MDQIWSPTSIVALKKAFGDSSSLFLRPDALPDVNHFRGRNPIKMYNVFIVNLASSVFASDYRTFYILE